TSPHTKFTAISNTPQTKRREKSFRLTAKRGICPFPSYEIRYRCPPPSNFLPFLLLLLLHMLHQHAVRLVVQRLTTCLRRGSAGGHKSDWTSRSKQLDRS